MLTIAAIGLYTPQSIPLYLNASLNLDTWFNFNNHNISLGTLRVAGQPIDRTNIIQYENVPFPQWTHNDLSFPILSIVPDQKAQFSDKTVALTARIPAARTRMNCSLLAYYVDQDLSVTGLELDYGAEFTPPLPCAGNSKTEHVLAHQETLDSPVGGPSALNMWRKQSLQPHNRLLQSLLMVLNGPSSTMVCGLRTNVS